MRILVTGASGLLGLNFCLRAAPTHTILGLDRGTLAGVPFELHHADLLSPDAPRRLIERLKPDAIIHTAANANVDSCEADPQGARRLNAEIPGELALACAQHSLRLLHISTDAVFDGTKTGDYTEEDDPNPLGVYAHTKLEGERNVLSAHPQACVARVNFFGWSLSGTRSLAEFFFNRLSASESCNGFTDIYFCPLFVGDLGDLLLEMLALELSGVYHTVGAQALSKHAFGQRLAERFGFDSSLVIPKSVEESGLKARRSHNLRLSIHKLSTVLGREIPTLSTGIDQFYTQAQQGYPQKMRSYTQRQR